MRFQQYLETANNRIAVIVQVEHVRFVENIEFDREGRAESMRSLIPVPTTSQPAWARWANQHYPAVTDAIDHVTKTCQPRVSRLGYFGVSAPPIRPYINRGYTRSHRSRCRHTFPRRRSKATAGGIATVTHRSSIRARADCSPSFCSQPRHWRSPKPSLRLRRISSDTPRFRTDLPGGRQANVATMRAAVVRADGTSKRFLLEELTGEPDSWTQFAGWSPDGRLAVVGRGWESPANARWEEEHKEFRYNAAGWLYDTIFFDIAADRATNVTAVDRVSFHNRGTLFLAEKSGEARVPGIDRRQFTSFLNGP